MFEFEENIIVTGFDRRTSKQGKEYTLVNILDNTGKTFGCILDCPIPSGVKQLDKVKAHFKVIPGRYVQLRVSSLSPLS